MTLDLTKLGIADADAKRMATQAHDQLQTARTAASVIYAPAALLALLGIVCGIRRRMGRLAGLFADPRRRERCRLGHLLLRRARRPAPRRDDGPRRNAAARLRRCRRDRRAPAP